MERVVVIAHRDIGDGWRALLVRRHAQPRWAVAWWDGPAEALVGESAEGVDVSHEGLAGLADDLAWTTHDAARAEFHGPAGGTAARGHTFWQELGLPVEAPAPAQET